MSATVLISGKLLRDPQRKTSSANRSYAQATVVVPQRNGGDAMYWNVMAFGDDEATEILRHHKGDSLAISGPMKAEIYTPKGKPSRVSLSMFADRVISHRRIKREQAEDAQPPAMDTKPKVDPFDDSIPF